MICIIDFGFVADCVFSQNRQKLSDESLQSQSGQQHTNTHNIVKCNWQNTWSAVGLRYTIENVAEKGFSNCNE